MADTGVWLRVELDDEGSLSVKAFARAEWRNGETVTVGDEVADSLPDDLRQRLAAVLAEVLVGCGPSAMALAKESAVDHAMAVTGKDRKGRRVIRFGAKLDVQGEVKGA